MWLNNIPIKSFSLCAPEDLLCSLLYRESKKLGLSKFGENFKFLFCSDFRHNKLNMIKRIQKHFWTVEKKSAKPNIICIFEVLSSN